jgi:hypothetical protein
LENEMMALLDYGGISTNDAESAIKRASKGGMVAAKQLRGLVATLAGVLGFCGCRVLCARKTLKGGMVTTLPCGLGLGLYTPEGGMVAAKQLRGRGQPWQVGRGFRGFWCNYNPKGSKAAGGTGDNTCRWVGV